MKSHEVAEPTEASSLYSDAPLFSFGFGVCKRSAFSDCIRFPYFPCLLSFDVKAVGQEQLSSGRRANVRST